MGSPDRVLVVAEVEDPVVALACRARRLRSTFASPASEPPRYRPADLALSRRQRGRRPRRRARSIRVVRSSRHASRTSLGDACPRASATASRAATSNVGAWSAPAASTAARIAAQEVDDDRLRRRPDRLEDPRRRRRRRRLRDQDDHRRSRDPPASRRVAASIVVPPTRSSRSRPPIPNACDTPAPNRWISDVTCWSPCPDAPTSPIGPRRTAFAKPSGTPSDDRGAAVGPHHEQALPLGQPLELDLVLDRDVVAEEEHVAGRASARGAPRRWRRSRASRSAPGWRRAARPVPRRSSGRRGSPAGRRRRRCPRRGASPRSPARRPPRASSRAATATTRSFGPGPLAAASASPASARTARLAACRHDQPGALDPGQLLELGRDPHELDRVAIAVAMDGPLDDRRHAATVRMRGRRAGRASPARRAGRPGCRSPRSPRTPRPARSAPRARRGRPPAERDQHVVEALGERPPRRVTEGRGADGGRPDRRLQRDRPGQAMARRIAGGIQPRQQPDELVVAGRRQADPEADQVDGRAERRRRCRPCRARRAARRSRPGPGPATDRRIRRSPESIGARPPAGASETAMRRAAAPSRRGRRSSRTGPPPAGWGTRVRPARGRSSGPPRGSRARIGRSDDGHPGPQPGLPQVVDAADEDPARECRRRRRWPRQQAVRNRSIDVDRRAVDAAERSRRRVAGAPTTSVARRVAASVGASAGRARAPVTGVGTTPILWTLRW